MTLPPDRIGDKGQRYVVQTTNYPVEGAMGWQDIGYANDQDAAQKLMNAMSQHPAVKHVRIHDREKK